MINRIKKWRWDRIVIVLALACMWIGIFIISEIMLEIFM